MNEHERVLRRRAVHDAADVGIELIVGLLNATRDHEMLGGVFAPERPYVGSFKTAETMVTRDTYLKFSKSEITARVPRGSVSHSRTAGNAGSIRREKDRHNRQSSCSGRHIFGQRDRRRGRGGAPRDVPGIRNCSSRVCPATTGTIPTVPRVNPTHSNVTR